MRFPKMQIPTSECATSKTVILSHLIPSLPSRFPPCGPDAQTVGGRGPNAEVENVAYYWRVNKLHNDLAVGGAMF